MYHIDFYYFDSGELKSGKIWELTIFTFRRVKLQEVGRFAHDCCVLGQCIAIDFTIMYYIDHVDWRVCRVRIMTESMRKVVNKITD